ncbi:hypothetical protein ABK040_014791 [Willaertia magna]
MSEEKHGVSKAALEVDPSETLFAKFARGDLNCAKVYEDDKSLVFKDIAPQAPVHFLIISKTVQIGNCHSATVEDATALGHLLYVAGLVAKQENLLDGYRLVINNGVNAQQSVNYLHIHMMAGRKFKWPPG